MGEGGSESDVFLFSSFVNKCYVDRLWARVYPLDFLSIRSNLKRLRELKEWGVLEQLSDQAWRVYRTLYCIKHYLSRGVSPDDIYVDRCLELELGEKEFVEFRYRDRDQMFFLEGEGFTVDSVKSVRLDYFLTDYGREKAIYMQIYPWLKIHIYPHMMRFRPHMIRMYYNFLIYARSVLGFTGEGYVSHSENWVDPHVIDVEKLRSVQRDLFKQIPVITERLWKVFFGDVNSSQLRGLFIRIGYVEFALDLYLDKIDLVMGSKFLGGSSKTIKSGGPVSSASFGSDFGVKYYVTLKKGLQCKIYSKAIRDNRILNRFEVTLDVNKSYYAITDIFKEINRKEVFEVVSIVKRYMTDRSSGVYSFIDGLVPESEKGNPVYYSFWFDLLSTGSIKSSRIYRRIVRYYLDRGVIRASGRGSATYYTLTPEYVKLRDEFRKHWGLTFELIELPQVGEIGSGVETSPESD